MRIDYLLFLLLRFIHPLPAEEPAWPPILEEPEIVMEEAYVRLETGETIYLQEGQDGTDVSMADLDLY